MDAKVAASRRGRGILRLPEANLETATTLYITRGIDELSLKRGQTAAISLTFDDAMDSHFDLAIPQFEAHGLRGTFCITAHGDKGGREGFNETMPLQKPRLSATEIKVATAICRWRPFRL